MNREEQPRSDSLQEQSKTSVPQEEKGIQTSPKRSLSLSQMILIGLVAGIGCGLFFGDWCANLQVVGDVFIGLLQMVVLPSIVSP